jgi:hypothetical protein
MEKTLDRPVVTSSGFNFNKLQAALCIASSAAVSMGLIYWGITSLL